MIASYSGYSEIIQELLQNGADSHKKDCVFSIQFGKKAIDRAKNKKCTEVLQSAVYMKSDQFYNRPAKLREKTLSLTKLIGDKKRGQPVTQKKNPRSLSEEKINLDVSHRRDLRGNIDERIKVISKAYDYHISQD